MQSEFYTSRKHLRTLAAQDTNEGSSQISQPPLGFEFDSQSYPLADNTQPSNERVIPSEASEQNQTVDVDKLKDYKRVLLKKPDLSEHDQRSLEAAYTKIVKNWCRNQP